jgi:hypothetical protein
MRRYTSWAGWLVRDSLGTPAPASELGPRQRFADDLRRNRCMAGRWPGESGEAEKQVALKPQDLK